MSLLCSLARPLSSALHPTPSNVCRISRFHTTILKMVQVERISAGDGQNFPKAGDTVTMHYTGTLAANGKEFDSSRKPGRGPFQTQIGVGRVIQGWDQGVPQLSLGERAKLHIPSNEGYGSQGAAGVIPPNADLIFDVELLAINGKKGKSLHTLKTQLKTVTARNETHHVPVLFPTA